MNTFFKNTFLSIVFVLLAPIVVNAGTITVDSSSDAFPYLDGFCTLREAIDVVNSGVSFVDCPEIGSPVFIDHDNDGVGVFGHEIQFASSTNGVIHYLGLALAGEDSNQRGDYDLHSPVIITGNGVSNTIFDGNGLDRLFHVIGGNTVIFRDLRIQHGYHTGGDGSGVKIDSSKVGFDTVEFGNNGDDGVTANYISNVYMDGVMMEGNQGAGLSVRPSASATVLNSTSRLNEYGIYNEGRLDVEHSTLDSNRVGLMATAANTSTLIDVTINSSTDEGIYQASTAGIVDATDTVVLGNGIGVYLDGTLLMTSSSVGSNQSHGIEGSAASSLIKLDDTEVNNNAGSGIVNAGAVLKLENSSQVEYNQKHGVEHSSTANFLIDYSSVSNNYGIGVENYSGKLDILNGSAVDFNEDEGVKDHSPEDLTVDFSTVNNNGDVGIYNTTGELIIHNDSHVSYNKKTGVQHLSAKSLDIDSSTFHLNERGGVHHSGRGGDAYIVNSDFTDNTMSAGGSGSVYAGGLQIDKYFGTRPITVLIEGCTFQGNSTTQAGGGLYLTENADVIDSIFTENHAHLGGAVYSSGALINFDDNVFAGNTATFNGGGLYIEYGGSVHLSSAVIQNNNAGGHFNSYDGGGGGIYSIGAELSIDNSRLESNFTDHVSSLGGGVYFSGDNSLNVSETEFLENSTGSKGGAIFARDDAHVDVDASIFDGNEAVLSQFSYGGAIYLDVDTSAGIGGVEFTGNHANDSGAALYGEDTVLNVSDSQFIQNTGVERGGAVYLLDSSASFNETEMAGNAAQLSGGGLFARSSSLYVLDGIFSSNIASIGAGFYVHAKNSDMVHLERIVSHDNLASDYGAGGYFISDSPSTNLDVINSTFSNNVSPSGAGLRLAGLGPVQLSHVTIAENIGYGLYVSHSATSIDNTLVGLNTDDNCYSSYSFLSTSYNSDSDGSCGFTDSTDLPNTSPQIYTLLDNGGFTKTHELYSSSPLVDAGNCTGGPTSDQRGAPYVRISGSNCDIGAFELQ